MISNSAPEAASLTDTQQLSRDAGGLLLRRIWLPKGIYDALPYFYIVSGIVAFFTTFYINSWFWVLPHYVLFAVGCLHLGVMIFRRRRRKAPDA